MQAKAKLHDYFEVYMLVDSFIKIVKVFKPNQVYMIGGTLIVAGLAGTSSPFWFPLFEDSVRQTFEISSQSKTQVVNSATILLSVFSMILGAILIILNRILEHKEQVSKRVESNVVELKSKETPVAFEADSGGSIVIKGGKIKNYSKVAKAKSSGVISISDTDVEK